MGDRGTLAEAFLARYGALGDAGVAPPELEALLAQVLLAGQGAWPGVALAPERFVSYVAERLARDTPLAEALRTLRVADLYLCCACTDGDPAAIAALEGQLLGSVDPALRRVAKDDSQVAEAKQLLRIKLLTRQGDELPKIADYSGRGDLRSWLRVAATRTALNLKRGAAVEEPLDDDLQAVLRAPGDTPEMQHLRTTYQEELREALGAAFQRLTGRQRNLLRQYHVDGLNILELGRVYRVHRVTAARWLEEARAAFLAQVRAILGERLGVETQTLTSILGLVASQVDVSIRTVLQTLPPRGPRRGER